MSDKATDSRYHCETERCTFLGGLKVLCVRHIGRTPEKTTQAKLYFDYDWAVLQKAYGQAIQSDVKASEWIAIENVVRKQQEEQKKALKKHG